MDWEEILTTDSEDVLKKAKIFLFQENMRLENERRLLEEEKRRVQQMQDDFIQDRVVLRDELNELNQKTLLERKRLREETLFFEKKLQILQDGFRALDEDRQKLERAKQAFEYEKASERQEQQSRAARKRMIKSSSLYDLDEVAEALFREVNNPMGLRKRYRDLMKIFHPDNMFGDSELVQAINREFQRRKDME